MEGEEGGAHKNCGNFELGRLSKECVLSTNEIDFVSENHSFVVQNIQATFDKLNRILTFFNVMQVFISIQNESVLLYCWVLMLGLELNYVLYFVKSCLNNVYEINQLFEIRL